MLKKALDRFQHKNVIFKKIPLLTASIEVRHEPDYIVCDYNSPYSLLIPFLTLKVQSRILQMPTQFCLKFGSSKRHVSDVTTTEEIGMKQGLPGMYILCSV